MCLEHSRFVSLPRNSAHRSGGGPFKPRKSGNGGCQGLERPIPQGAGCLMKSSVPRNGCERWGGQRSAGRTAVVPAADRKDAPLTFAAHPSGHSKHFRRPTTACHLRAPGPFRAAGLPPEVGVIAQMPVFIAGHGVGKGQFQRIAEEKAGAPGSLRDVQRQNGPIAAKARAEPDLQAD